MRHRPLLLDLYCKAGGAAEGYYRAGFDVIGVDLHRQRNYPAHFHFIQADVRKLTVQWVQAFDAIHASPPCQFASEITPDPSRHLNLIPATRDLLLASGRPFVIENVDGAKAHLREPVMLCGSMFGLGTATHRLERHRWFEVHGFTLPRPACAHDGRPVIGVYGGHARDRGGKARSGGKTGVTRDFVGQSQLALAREALGMNWGTLGELSEAIPPAYTEWIGRHLLASLGGHHVENLGQDR